MDQRHHGAVKEDGNSAVDIDIGGPVSRERLSDLEKADGLKTQGVGLLNSETGGALGFRTNLYVIVGLALEIALGTEEKGLIVGPLELASHRRVDGKGLLNGLVIHRLVEANEERCINR
jgi:hypothetical protein